MAGTDGSSSGIDRRARGDLKQEVLHALLASDTPMTPGAVRDAIDPDLAYTTVMTVLARLCDQGLVARRRAGRAFAYTAVADQAEVTARQMHRLLETGDDRATVLSRFLGVLSDDDERTLIELIGRIDEGGTR
ncbi:MULTISPECIES: BlaI/MecI/CopY family transcriptional regulator [Micromonospora]|uniref:BlaI/MecI/CopY family transcriptional regulator n=1 Tax=Micromonospora solifontis TaxID=2487138 RepID=A0ABX9W958_9ACTN|nr:MULTISPECIES: BlaI/MecI/CopY family transcriptional regulator [Micromonospora]NES17224.1 BlaI/MecI/CopY family transcriptional regulator [Micromonospora sp. PPF5-17B]NES39429.1 BlaI/MecI/CopY family transcriptional regulator [Micromonospora solifontis]NES59014.1 BlaI/MecI/CopY family transcriptional regulator [Micromonospora sp. PPF5-6]RNL88997.1 BlaI/MecI/CopY family transcriptional regulator [Micromonospora solifontis]